MDRHVANSEVVLDRLTDALRTLCQPTFCGRFDELAEEFPERYRRGERPTIEEYVDRLPAMAEEIREMFPALVEVEQAEGDAQDEALGKKQPAGPRLEVLGDYRIVRKIGHGGMGLVYEAEQMSIVYLDFRIPGNRTALMTTAS